MDKYTHDRDDPRIAEEQAARAERCAAAAAVADIFFFCLFLRLQNFNFFVMSMSLFFQIKASLRNFLSPPPCAQLNNNNRKKYAHTRKKKRYT